MLRGACVWAAAIAVLATSWPVQALSNGYRPRIGLVAHDNVLVYSGPTRGSDALAVLVEQTQIEVLRQQSGWTRVRLWRSITGWVRQRDIVFRKPWESVSHYQAPEIHYHVHAYPPSTLARTAIVAERTGLYWAPGRTIVRPLPVGTRVRISAWLEAADGKVWYRVGALWSPAAAIRLDTPNPGRVQVRGKPIWTRASGKGMWLTLGIASDRTAATVIRAGTANHISHLYVESAISPLGFHGRNSVGHLLDAAHRAGIAVFAWVYPYLYDIAGDVALTREVAGFRSPAGERFDGIAADLETNASRKTVRVYSDLIRAYLGPNYALIGVTFPPSPQSTYPFDEIADQYNVVAPMDYWHQTRTSHGLDYGHMSYGYHYGYRYAFDSVRSIRAVSGDIPVEPIGQVFDNFGRLEMGPYAPSGQEIRGFVAGSKAAGAIGVSFFQWMTATDAEWRVIHDACFSC